MKEQIINEILSTFRIAIENALNESKLPKTRQMINFGKAFSINYLDDKTHDPIYYEILSYLVNQEIGNAKINFKIQA